jgi:hypothetical protein
MAKPVSDDIMLPTLSGASDARPARSSLVAFVPISIALVGVAAILLGHVTAQDVAAAQTQVDPIETGSIELAPASGYGIDAVAR